MGWPCLPKRLLFLPLIVLVRRHIKAVEVKEFVVRLNGLPERKSLDAVGLPVHVPAKEFDVSEAVQLVLCEGSSL